MTRRLLVLTAALTATLSLAACTSSPSLARARSWEARGHETRTSVRTTIAAAVVVPAPPPPVTVGGAPEGSIAPAVRRSHRPEVRLFTVDNADCPTEALGVVNERAYDGNEAAAVERIKAKARAMGADAVVGYRTAPSPAGTSLDLAGVAVRCATLTNNRPYDTLGTIEVPTTTDGEGAGNEQDAFDELLARADKMHANLVLDVRVVPGQNGTGGKVVGAAIRYR